MESAAEHDCTLTAHMASGRTMCWTQLWLLAFLAASSLTSVAAGSPLKVMSAPNLLRVGTAENVFVECQDCSGGDIMVTINVMNHPTKTSRLASTSVTLTSANRFQGFALIKIPAGDFSKDPTVKQYVYLQAQFPDQVLEKVVLVSFQSGYIFIQTDKTLYTPNSRVHYRMFALTPRMEPVERDDTTDAIITIEIVNPEGFIFNLDTVSLKSGIYSGDYQLGEMVSPGSWKVVSKFHSNPQESFSADFEVKEYVLPSFEVKLIPQSSFFYVDSQQLTVDIKTTYLFGEGVEGTAFVIFGVVHEGQKKSLPGSLQRVPIVDGNGVAQLKREHITQTFININYLVGSSIFVAVSVLTVNGGEMVETELGSIQIVTSPYTIHLKKTPKYFKPGSVFDVTLEVVNPDGTPAQRVLVVVEPGAVQTRTTAKGIAKCSINTMSGITSLTVTAKTNDPLISPERQASATMEALAYKTRNNNYIHIGVDAAELESGDYLKFNLNLNSPPNEDTDITYLVLSRGRLVKHGRYRTRSQVLISLTVPITKELLPSFRIIAYYHTSDNEVVSDSVWVDAKDSCVGLLKLESTKPAPSYEPRRMFGLKVTGDPEATVGLVAVDKGVYVLNNKHFLTQKKVWDIVRKYDTGCTPGGGQDSMGVFYDAGLLFESSAASGTPHRQELRCPSSRRKKRASTTPDDTSSSSDYEGYTYTDSPDIISRTLFPESWLWSNIKLPACPRQTPNCESTSFVQNIPLRDSITTWQFIGIGLSTTHGICVSSPLEVIVRKEFFIDLKLPYSAMMGEQLEIKAILHNNNPYSVIVRVDLTEEQHVCSAASTHGRHRQEVKVGPFTTRSVPFVIIPMKEGQFGIEVKAAVRESSLTDGISKRLFVRPNGVLVKSPRIITLDPVNKGVDGTQEVIINSGISRADLVPNTPVKTIIFLRGRENTTGLVENAISAISMGSLIYKPAGNGENIMYHVTMPVIATVYLDKTNQWETVGFEKRNEALQYIRTGYQKELDYRKNDGSFSMFTSRASTTWLTAYVVKVFAMAFHLVPMQTQIICDAVKFLILNTQQPEGLFREVGSVIHREMIGDVLGRDSDASMTAFCLIALQKSHKICAATVNSLPDSINKAVAYLENRLPSLINPYAVAMTSYALANENKLNREILYRFVSPELSHWPSPHEHLFTLEATAYALLALTKAKAFEDARPVVRWLNTQQKVGGGYGSIQATLMVYQAVAEYWASAREQEYNLNVDIFLPGRSRPDQYTFNQANHYVTRLSMFHRINEDVRVKATGVGEATLTMMSMYYALPKEQESDCQKFNLTVQLLPVKLDGDEKIYNLTIEILYKDRERDAALSILDISLPNGFTVNTADLHSVLRQRDNTISKYEMQTVLSEKGSLIIYLDKVSHTQPEEITFRIHQELKAGVLQPAAVSVYEYYDQTNCVKFYHPERHGNLQAFCTNDECRCGGHCRMQPKNNVNNDERSAKVCESTLTGKMDFVYKARVVNFAQVSSTGIHTMSIVQVIKEGSFDVNLQGKLRTFHSPLICRNVLNLRLDKTYLIMGPSNDIRRDDQSESYRYTVSEKTWIEYWPTDAECQTEEHRLTCLGLEEMVMQMTLFGCSD